MDEARTQILDMVSRGKITVDDAETLLFAHTSSDQIHIARFKNS